MRMDRVVTDALAVHEPELRRFVAARIGASEVEDVLQLAALRAIERSASLEDPERVRAWLFTIHRNLITDTLRQQARRERLADRLSEEEEPSPDVDPCDCSTVQAARLRPSYGSVLSLVDSGGATLQEAAETLGITVNNAAVRLHRARKALREAMREHCGVESAADCLDCRCVMDGCCAA